MIKKLKKFFLPLICVVVFGLLLPLKPASAGILSWLGITGIATAVPSVVVSFAVFILGVLSSIFAGFAGWLLTFVLSPAFTSLSYTNPATNPVIDMGLKITQGFANIILVLILIYIGLATILRLAGYETKKMLVSFVIAALLVNFSPVICGLIVDAANIVMNYLAKPLIGPGGLSSLVTHIVSIWKIYSSGWNFDVLVSSAAQAALIFKLIAAAIFYFLLALGLLMYAGIFIIRYVAIWILVILSPIAFVCRILPPGSGLRKVWDMWWQQFIQWSIIGILAMFFLYLAVQLMVDAPILFKAGIGGDYGWFDMILPYVVPLAFLYLGFVVTQQTTAFGAKGIISLATKGGKAAASSARGRGWQWTEKGARTVKSEAGKIRQSYQIQKVAFGDTRTRALGTAIRGSWQTRIRPAITTPATYKAAGKGIFSAVKDAAMAGAKASFGIKKKGQILCNSCGGAVPAGSEFCLHCRVSI